MRIDTYYGLYKAETSIQHGTDEKMETTALCRYNTFLKDGKSIRIYNISVSTFRHTIRDSATDRLLSILGMSFEDLPEISQIIFKSGGPRLEKGEVVPLAFIKAVRKWFPLIDLMGTTTPFCMIEGRLYPTEINTLTRSLIEGSFYIEDNIVKEFSLQKDLLPEIVTEFQFNTKRDPRAFMVDDVKNIQYGTVANMFDTQQIIKGTLLGHQVVIRDYENQMLGSCVSSALAEWIRGGSYIAGKKSQGCGKVSFKYSPLLPSTSIYEDFVAANKDMISSLIMNKKVWEDKNTILSMING